MAAASTVQRNVLVCGDGNFSFSAAVARLLRHGEAEPFEELTGLDAPVALTCTSFDREAELLTKYPECRTLLPALRQSRVAVVRHGVNAWQLADHFGHADAGGFAFDCVVWNHPHLGTEDFNLHRFLLCHFFDSCRQVLRPGGCVAVAVLRGQDTRWRVAECAARAGFQLEKSGPFYPSAFPGYETRRNRTGGSFQNAHTQLRHRDALPSVMYRFRMADREAAAAAAPATQAVEEPPKAPAPKPFACRSCSKAFTSAQGLKVHTRQVHELGKYGPDWAPQRERAFRCEHCSKSFADAEALWQHRIARHSLDIDIPFPRAEQVGGPALEAPEEDAYEFFPCAVCGMSVSSHPDWGMAAHLESLKPIIGLELECGIGSCTKTFIELRALRQHRNFCAHRGSAPAAQARPAAPPGERRALPALLAAAELQPHRRFAALHLLNPSPPSAP